MTMGSQLSGINKGHPLLDNPSSEKLSDDVKPKTMMPMETQCLTASHINY